MSSEIPDISTITPSRRIVTGHDENGTSKILYDDAEGKIDIRPGTSRMQNVWFTDEVPVDCSSATAEDPTPKKNFYIHNDHGSVCTVVEMRPGQSSMLHRTETLDYGVVVEGEIELEMANGDRRLMKAGDVIVQRGTLHAWHNKHPTKWSKVFFVLIALKRQEGSQGASD